MAYKTRNEKRAWRAGLFAGLKKRKKQGKKKSTYNPHRRKAKPKARSSSNPFGMTYMQMLREEELRKRDLLGDFDYDSRGRIKGHYTVDGKFEPD